MIFIIIYIFHKKTFFVRINEKSLQFLEYLKILIYFEYKKSSAAGFEPARA